MYTLIHASASPKLEALTNSYAGSLVPGTPLLYSSSHPGPAPRWPEQSRCQELVEDAGRPSVEARPAFILRFLPRYTRRVPAFMRHLRCLRVKILVWVYTASIHQQHTLDVGKHDMCIDHPLGSH